MTPVAIPFLFCVLPCISTMLFKSFVDLAVELGNKFPKQPKYHHEMELLQFSFSYPDTVLRIFSMGIVFWAMWIPLFGFGYIFLSIANWAYRP